MRRTGVITALTGALAVVVSMAAPTVAATTAPTCTIRGTTGADVLRGTPGPDVICGLGGDDTLIGGGGADLLLGGTGDDTLRGGAGADRLLGGAGEDRLVGDTGNDRLDGGVGDDELLGGAGADLMRGRDGADALMGGAGADRGNGDLGADTCVPEPDVVGCSADVTPPEMTLVDAPASVSPGETFEIRWRVADVSGVQVTTSYMYNLNGFQPWCFSPVTRLVSGDDRDGVYEIQCSVPERMPSAPLTLQVWAADFLGNSNVTSALEVTIDVVGGIDDTEAPAFEVLERPSSAAAGTAFAVRWRATDATGIGFGLLWLRGPDYSVIGFDGSASDPVLVEGDARDGVWEQTFTLPARIAVGEYEMLIWIGDTLGNRTVESLGSLTVGSA